MCQSILNSCYNKEKLLKLNTKLKREGIDSNDNDKSITSTKQIAVVITCQYTGTL